MNAVSLLKPAFDWVLHATWSASILIGLVLLLQWLLRDKLAPRWRYALWLLVVVRLALPVSPGSAVSVFNFAKVEAAKPVSLENPAPAATPGQSVSNAESGAAASASGRRPRWLAEATDEETELRFQLAGATRTLKTPEVAYWIAFALWGPVSAFFLLRWLWQNARFVRRMRAGRSVGQPEVLQLFEECRALSGVRRNLELLSIEEITSPALYGLFRLRLLLPKDFLASFKRDELRHILLHELAHVKRWDTAVNAIAAILQMLHWFNPLVRLAFRRMALDRELACDEMALNCLKQGENEAYGATMIRLLESASERLPNFTTVGILEDYRQMLTRIQCVARYGRSTAHPVVVVGLFALLAVAGLSDAQNASDPQYPASLKVIESTTRTIHLTGWEAGDSSLSPDETRIVFDHWRSPGADVVVKDLRTQETWKLADAKTNWYFAETTVWSPDSKRIAYTWYTDEADEIRIATADGNENRLLRAVPWNEDYYPFLIDWPSDDANPVWTPDGKHVLFGSNRRGQWELWAVPMEGGRRAGEPILV
ncbi:MAG: hypothetical protein FJ398_20790 [Verrucomicrobia bacterium]|nr:hypothetical protein [Verrucomicrobiota bacterium]